MIKAELYVHIEGTLEADL